MSKRAITIVVIFLLMLTFATPAHCGDALRKLGRGISNSLTFPLEIISQVSKTNNTDGPMAAMTYGLLKGVAMTGLRAIVGVYEVATFPIPFPKHYEAILTDPEFFLEEKNW